MKLGYILMCIGIIGTWLAFITMYDPDIVRQVVYGVAGWQVGSWTAKIARHCNS